MDKVWLKFFIGFFVIALIVLGFGYMFNARERAATVDQHSPVGQIRQAPNLNDAAPVAQPPQTQPASR
jgi:hypothetical protein